MVSVYRREETGTSYKELIDLIHESFEERLAQGLVFSTSSMTEEEYVADTRGGTIYVAIDEDLKTLVGTAFVKIRSDEQGAIYGGLEYCAVKNEYKHKGIGTMLFKVIEQHTIDAGGEYILSDTSVSAKSSVRYHLKNGFKIVGLESYMSTNYYSYVFRKQLKPSRFWDNLLLVKCRFILSCIYKVIEKRKNGRFTILGKLMKKIKKCVNCL